MSKAREKDTYSHYKQLEKSGSTIREIWEPACSSGSWIKYHKILGGGIAVGACSRGSDKIPYAVGAGIAVGACSRGLDKIP